MCVCEKDKATASRALHTRVYGTSNTATLRIHSDELKNKNDNNVTARLKNKGFNSCTDVVLSSLLCLLYL